jgi:PE-PPE domain
VSKAVGTTIAGYTILRLRGLQILCTCGALLLCGFVTAPPTGLPSASFDVALRAFLSGGSEALVMGPTQFPTPDSSFLDTVDRLYLEPLGFTGETVALTTPETFDFGPSVAQGVTDMVHAVTSEFDAGDFGPTDPLVVFGYSQSAVVASLAMQQLSDDGIPEDDLRFVLIGDTASAQGGFLNTFINSLPVQDQDSAIQLLDSLGLSDLIGVSTPNDLYPADIYTIQGDAWADWPSTISTSFQADEDNVIYGLLLHETYLGLTPQEIASATSSTDGLTDYFTIAQPHDVLETLLTAVLNAYG